MKLSVIFVFVGIVCSVTYVHADCDDPEAAKNPEDGDVKILLKKIGCSFKKGAEDLGETAKPWADKIGSVAKGFGSSVAQKYEEIKHKLTDDNNSDNVAGAASSAYLENVPTEKVPLAPLAGDAAHAAAAARMPEGTGA